MIDVAGIVCASCSDTIEPGDTATYTKWCKCGRTYLHKTPQSVGWGGPSNPQKVER